MSLFFASAHAQASAPAPQGGELFQILFLVGMFALFYFIARSLWFDGISWGGVYSCHPAPLSAP
jgi:hypothetical protein